VLFEWDEGNLGHIEQHGITAEEAEEVFRSRPMQTAPYERAGEVRAPVVGRTASGRVLTVAFTMRGAKVRVVTGWDASRKERKQYVQYAKNQTV
jgi:uncharacterized DUF497 family protein